MIMPASYPAVETGATPGRGNRRYQLSTTTYSRHVTTNHKIWDHLTLDAFGADTTPVRGNAAAPDVETIGYTAR